MTSLPEQLQSLISSSNISADLGGQIGSITSAASTLSNLIASPPEEIDDLIGGLSNISLTNIRLPDDFLGGFSNISGVIPTDLTSITGGLDTLLSGISEGLDIDVLNSIQEFIGCLEKLSLVIEMDFSKFSFVSSSSSSSGSPQASSLEGPPEGSGGQGVVSAETGVSTIAKAPESSGVTAAKNVSELLGSFPTPFNVENAIGFFQGAECILNMGL